MAETVADTFFKRLFDWGGDTVFGLPGDGVNGIFEALRTHPEKIRFIQVRHEGGIHLLNGLYDAKFAGQPVLAITGHTFHELIGTHFQQAMGLDKLFMDGPGLQPTDNGPCSRCRRSGCQSKPRKTALARRGVAHLTIAKDIQDWEWKGKRLRPRN